DIGFVCVERASFGFLQSALVEAQYADDDPHDHAHDLYRAREQLDLALSLSHDYLPLKTAKPAFTVGHLTPRGSRRAGMASTNSRWISFRAWRLLPVLASRRCGDSG